MGVLPRQTMETPDGEDVTGSGPLFVLPRQILETSDGDPET
jgi:hypothetical protein